MFSNGGSIAHFYHQIKHNEVMEIGDKIWLPVSIAEMRISKRYDTIPSGTLYPNADEIAYLQRLVRFKVTLNSSGFCGCFTHDF